MAHEAVEAVTACATARGSGARGRGAAGSAAAHEAVEDAPELVVEEAAGSGLESERNMD